MTERHISDTYIRSVLFNRGKNLHNWLVRGLLFATLEGTFKIRRRDCNENVKKQKQNKNNNNRFRKQNTNFARASHFFVHFFAVCARPRRKIA